MDPFTLALIGTGIFGGLGSLFGGKGKEIEPKPSPRAVPWGLDVLSDWLFSPFMFNQEAGTWEMRGVPPYGGQLSPDVENTILPNVWSQAGQPNPAMSLLQQQIANGFQPSPRMQEVQESMMQFGGPPGQVTDQMWKQAQWGGAGMKGQPAMDNLLQFGVASQGPGQYLSNLAQFGIPSEAGRLIANRSQGFPVAGATWLKDYAKPAPYVPQKRSK
jgi:hypothetical protein